MPYVVAVFVFLFIRAPMLGIAMFLELQPWIERVLFGKQETFLLWPGLLSPFNAMTCIATYLVATRWWRTHRLRGVLLSEAYCAERRAGYQIGMAFAWLGHIVLVGLAIRTLWMAMTATHGNSYVGVGLVIGLALELYSLAVLIVEVSHRRWERNTVHDPSRDGIRGGRQP